MSRKLQIKKPNIYVIDHQTNITEILSTKSEYQRVLLYDVHQFSTNALNQLLNTTDNEVSFVAIQNPKDKISPHVSDLFALSFIYNQEDQNYEVVHNEGSKK